MNIIPVKTNNTTEEQLNKIYEEMSEVMEAYKIYLERRTESLSLKHLAEEVIDVQTACETLLVILGLNAHERDNMRKFVFAKNNARGYYDD